MAGLPEGAGGASLEEEEEEELPGEEGEGTGGSGNSMCKDRQRGTVAGGGWCLEKRKRSRPWKGRLGHTGRAWNAIR